MSCDLPEGQTQHYKHAALLNALVDMQNSPAYAVRKSVLAEAEIAISSAEIEFQSLKTQRDELLAALKECRRSIGDHNSPDDCYATGPITGDAIRDLVQCPACSAIAMYDAAIAKAEKS